MIRLSPRAGRAPLAAVAALLLAAGCSGGDSSEDAAGDLASQLASAGENASGDVDIDDIDNAADAILPDQCEFLFDLGVAPGLVASGQLDPSSFDDIDAPDEIADEVETYLAAIVLLVEDPANAGTALSTPEVTAAGEAISAYVDENCSDLGIGN